jgi:hypothetical protein
MDACRSLFAIRRIGRGNDTEGVIIVDQQTAQKPKATKQERPDFYTDLNNAAYLTLSFKPQSDESEKLATLS